MFELEVGKNNLRRIAAPNTPSVTSLFLRRNQSFLTNGTGVGKKFQTVKRFKHVNASWANSLTAKLKDVRLFVTS